MRVDGLGGDRPRVVPPDAVLLLLVSGHHHIDTSPFSNT